jgi:hypothetical protein
MQWKDAPAARARKDYGGTFGGAPMLQESADAADLSIK